MKRSTPVLCLLGFFLGASTIYAVESPTSTSKERQLECAAELLGAFREVTPELRQRLVSAPPLRKLTVEILARDVTGGKQLPIFLETARTLGVLAVPMDSNPLHLQATGLSQAVPVGESHFSRFYLIGTTEALRALVIPAQPETLPAIFFASSESLTHGQPAFTQKLLTAIAQLTAGQRSPRLARVTPNAELALSRARTLKGATVTLSLGISNRDLPAIGSVPVEVLNLGQDQSEFDPTGFGGPHTDISGLVVRGEAQALDRMLLGFLPGASAALQDSSFPAASFPNDAYNRRSLTFFLKQGLSARQVLALLPSYYYRWGSREIDAISALPEGTISEIRLKGQAFASDYWELHLAARDSERLADNSEHAKIKVLDSGVVVPTALEERQNTPPGSKQRQFPFEVLIRGTQRQIVATLARFPQEGLTFLRSELVLP